MKANELRIGNLIHENQEHLDLGDGFGKVQSDGNIPVTLKMLHEIGGFCGMPDGSKVPQYLPIPLTEEWMLKFGEINTGVNAITKEHLAKLGKTSTRLNVQDSHYPIGDLYIDFDDKGACYLQNEMDGYIFGKEIKSVHQLQNLYYALTGSELTIRQ